MDKIKVKIVYRNYKPLHENYNSFKSFPPENVEFSIPDTKKYIAKFMPLYVRFGDNPVFKTFIGLAQRYLFDSSANASDDSDVLHYLHMLPETMPEKPFVVDIEHVSALSNFVQVDDIAKNKIKFKLNHELCKGVICLSNASKETLSEFMGDEYHKIEHKVFVVYPSLPNYLKLNENIGQKDRSKFRLLFVGKNPERKGLIELIMAVKNLNQENDNIILEIYSETSSTFENQYNYKFLEYKGWGIPKDKLIASAFLRSDLFVLPTRGDTFGMVILDAMSSGLPVIATDQFAIPEMVKDDYNGFLVDSEFAHLRKGNEINRGHVIKNKFQIDAKMVDQLVEKIKMIYQDEDMQSRMSKNSNKEFDTGGKFSIEKRNSQLSQIYLNVLKD